MEKITFPVDRTKLAPYFFRYFAWQALFFTLISFGLGLPGLVAWFVGWGGWYCRNFDKHYDAWLEDKRICVNDGVVFRKRKSIPLDRVTDIVISQGWVERRMDICQIRIQTPGAGAQNKAEAVIYALPESEADAIRDMINAARDKYSEGS